MLIDEQPALAFVEKNNELTIADEEFAVEEYAIGIAKENTELLYQVNDALEAVKVNGTMDEIVANYIGDEKGEHPYESPEGLTRENGTLTMATNVAFPPYEYYEDKTAVGIDIDMMQAIADYLNMDLVVSDMEFDSVIMAVQSGKADVAAAGLTVTEDRLKNISFSESYTTAKQVIIYNNGEKAEKMSLADKIYQTFIEKNRWQYIPKGLANTLLITVFSGLIGILIGSSIANVRVAYERNDEKSVWIRILNAIFKVYITVFRGTPMVVQLLIMYYVVFAQTAVNPLIAAVIAFAIIAIFVILVYRLPGVITVIALIGQMGLSVAAISRYFTVFNSFTMTLPGIAGIILSIGMGVDANIITAERIKEEFRNGKTLDGAIDRGTKSSLSAIVDGNMTVVIVSIILLLVFGTANILSFMFGASTTGTIYAFGYTLLMGVISNFIMGVLLSRVMLKSVVGFKCVRKKWLFGGAKNNEE